MKSDCQTNRKTRDHWKRHSGITRWQTAACVSCQTILLFDVMTFIVWQIFSRRWIWTSDVDQPLKLSYNLPELASAHSRIQALINCQKYTIILTRLPAQLCHCLVNFTMKNVRISREFLYALPPGGNTAKNRSAPTKSETDGFVQTQINHKINAVGYSQYL